MRKGSGPAALEQRNIDVSALGLGVEEISPVQEEPPRMALAREKVLEEAAKAIEAENKGQAGVSLVVIGEPVYDIHTVRDLYSPGHVDAGKSTLMGRLLYDAGRVDEKSKMANERASSKIGKGSFSWAWQFDGTTEERER
jgi:elongation factor 1 alpha-like protein